MKLTPSSGNRRSVASAARRSGGGPQIPRPVIRMAPYPRRLMVRSPNVNRPAALALMELMTAILRDPASPLRTSSAAVMPKAAAHPVSDDGLELGCSLLPDAVTSLENIQARIGQAFA